MEHFTERFHIYLLPKGCETSNELLEGQTGVTKRSENSPLSAEDVVGLLLDE